MFVWKKRPRVWKSRMGHSETQGGRTPNKTKKWLMGGGGGGGGEEQRGKIIQGPTKGKRTSSVCGANFPE